MATDPVSLALDEGWSAPGPQLVNQSRHNGGHVLDVVAVSVVIGHPVGGGSFGEPGRVLRVGEAEFGVVVVLAAEHHGELPDGGEIGCFVEGPLGDGAVAEEGHHDTPVAPEAAGQAGAGGDGEPTGHDAVGTKDPDPGVGQVHGSSSAPACPAVLGHELGEGALHIEALGQYVAVAPVCRGDEIVRTERPRGADGGRFLPDGEVHEAGDEPVAVQLRHPFLEPPDAQHPAVPFKLVRQVALGGHGVS
jgi:hypothetical protein